MLGGESQLRVLTEPITMFTVLIDGYSYSDGGGKLDGGLPIIIVFLGGLFSFLSPCVFPLLPVYITYLAGASVEEISGNKKIRDKLIVNSLSFVAGFTLVFMAFGASASSIGVFLLKNQVIIRKVSGMVIVLFGLQFLGFLRFKSLYKEKKWQPKIKRGSVVSSFVFGMAFSAGWTPCVGPILASVLLYSSTAATIKTGLLLLLFYSLGLAVPFLLFTVFTAYFFNRFSGLMKYSLLINKVGGVFLLIIGLMLFTNSFSALSTGFAGLNLDEWLYGLFKK